MQEGNESFGKPKQNEKGCSGKIWDNLHIRFSYSTERKKCKNPYIPEGETEPNCHVCDGCSDRCSQTTNSGTPPPTDCPKEERIGVKANWKQRIGGDASG